MRQILPILFLPALPLAGCSKDNGGEPACEGIEINGVTWSGYNVDAPGTFTARPRDAGMYYQWNRKTGWSASEPMASSPAGAAWDDTDATGEVWEPADDPCPAGRRLLTCEEQMALCDEGRVACGGQSQTVEGVRYTDKTSLESIFLPDMGYCDPATGSFNDIGSDGYYWSDRLNTVTDRHGDLYFRSPPLSLPNNARTAGFSVRCIRK